MRRVKRTAAAVAGIVLAASVASACDSPSTSDGRNAKDDRISTQVSMLDPSAKGPAPEVAGAKKGGTITAYAESTPTTFDPTEIYYTDAHEIAKLVFRTPTQFAVRDGRAVLVPDLTDLGTVSADKLTWTFKFKNATRYADGSPVKVQDLAYAIKRSFAREVYVSGPAYQLRYFKDGATYKGPYVSGDTYAGVETPDENTLVIHLAKPFSDLPFFMSFPMFTPIPQARDTRQDYQNRPMATGPYQFETYTAGTELRLKRNPNWNAATDPVRHQYPDAFAFAWGGEHVKIQQQVLSSNGADATAIEYDGLDATLIPQLRGARSSQLIRGDSPCTVVGQLDTRKIPLEVRKAIAVAYPYDQTYKASGQNEYNAEIATTILPPSVPGHTRYTPLPGLTGTGAGDPASARKALQEAGKVGFELSWYYDNTKPLGQQISQIRADALTQAGFTVKPIGIPTAQVRARTSDYAAPVNMGQAPSMWCSDWPSGGSWFPVLFESHGVDDGSSWGMLGDAALDQEIEQIASLPVDQSVSKWAALDQKVMGRYTVLPRYHTKMAILVGTGLGGAKGDPATGMPLFTDLYVKG